MAQPRVCRLRGESTIRRSPPVSARSVPTRPTNRRGLPTPVKASELELAATAGGVVELGPVPTPGPPADVVIVDVVVGVEVVDAVVGTTDDVAVVEDVVDVDVDVEVVVVVTGLIADPIVCSKV